MGQLRGIMHAAIYDSLKRKKGNLYYYHPN